MAPPALGGASYFSDAAVLIPELGIPMVLCGPGRPDLAHQPDEHVEAARVEEAEEAHVALIRRLLGLLLVPWSHFRGWLPRR